MAMPKAIETTYVQVWLRAGKTSYTKATEVTPSLHFCIHDIAMGTVQKYVGLWSLVQSSYT